MTPTPPSRDCRLLLLLAGVILLALAVVATQAWRGRADRARELRLANIQGRIEAQAAAIPGAVERQESLTKHLLLDAVADCVTTERIGRRGDGGKWLCNPYKLRRPCVVYGVGAGSDVSFEIQMAKKFGCEVHLFDPSPSLRKQLASLEQPRGYGEGTLTYHPWGLGPVSDDPATERNLSIEGQPCEVKTLDEIAAALGHTRIQVLKIDIEGGELAVIPDLLRRSLLAKYGVEQLLVEFHAFEGGDFARTAKGILALEDAGMLLFRKELNPTDATRCAEYAFARKDVLLD